MDYGSHVSIDYLKPEGCRCYIKYGLDDSRASLDYIRAVLSFKSKEDWY